MELVEEFEKKIREKEYNKSIIKKAKTIESRSKDI